MLSSALYREAGLAGLLKASTLSSSRWRLVKQGTETSLVRPAVSRSISMSNDVGTAAVNVLEVWHLLRSAHSAEKRCRHINNCRIIWVLSTCILCSENRRSFLIPAASEKAEDALRQAKQEVKSTVSDAKSAATDAKDTARQKVKSDQPNALKFFADLAAGGTAGGVSKTVVAPIERVKLLLQTQDSNPRIKSGEIARYTGWAHNLTGFQGFQRILLCWGRPGSVKKAMHIMSSQIIMKFELCCLTCQWAW